MTGQSGQTVQSTSSPPPQVMAAYGNLTNAAQNVAGQPLQQYRGPMVAGFTPQQQQGFSEIGAAQGIGAPFINAAAQQYGRATAPLWSQLPQYGTGTVNRFLSPYTSDVTGALTNLYNQQNQQRASQIEGDAVSQGAFGGDREPVAQALAMQQEQLSQAPTLSQVEQQGFQGAQAEFNQQQQAQLGANQANAWLASQAGFGLGGLGQEAQAQALGGAQALIGAGGMQQQLAQEQMNIPYEQFVQAQAYPYQQLGFLAPIVEGTGSLSGGTSRTTYPGPSPISQIAGLGITGAGIYGLGSQQGWWGNNNASRGGRIGYADGGIPSVPDIGGGVPSVDLSYIPQQAPGAKPNPMFNATQPVTTTTSGGGGGGGGLGDIGALATLGKFALGLFARGGRIVMADGGGIGAGSGDGFGTLPVVPRVNLDFIASPGPAIKGEGPPKPPPAPQNAPDQGLNPGQMLSSLKDLKGLGVFDKKTPDDTDTEPHKYGGGIGKMQIGGQVPLAAAVSFGGASPGIQQNYQQLMGLPVERLQEMATQYPPTTSQGQMVQRALQQKRMGVGFGTQQTMAEGGVAGNGWVTEDELDPVPEIDHSGDTVKVRYPSEGKVLDLGIPSLRRHLAAGGASGPSTSAYPMLNFSPGAGGWSLAEPMGGWGGNGFGDWGGGMGFGAPQSNGVGIPQVSMSTFSAPTNANPGGGIGDWFQPLSQYVPPGGGQTGPNGTWTWPMSQAYTPGLGGITGVYNSSPTGKRGGRFDDGGDVGQPSGDGDAFTAAGMGLPDTASKLLPYLASQDVAPGARYQGFKVVQRPGDTIEPGPYAAPETPGIGATPSGSGIGAIQNPEPANQQQPPPPIPSMPTGAAQPAPDQLPTVAPPSTSTPQARSGPGTQISTEPPKSGPGVAVSGEPSASGPGVQLASAKTEAPDLAFYGDSIAHGSRLAANAPGVTQVGWHPDQVLGSFTGADLTGKTAVISSGITNSTNIHLPPDQWQKDINLVPQQIDAARSAGAKDVVLYGVGEGVRDNKNINERLAEIAASKNAQFVPLIGTGAYTDNAGAKHPPDWHPKDYDAQVKYTLGQIGAPVRPGQPNETGAQASAPLPDLWTRVKGMEHGVGANGEALVSSKGAVGISQIIPSTAQDMAKDLGLPYDEQRLHTDTRYNELLGKHYLDKMLDKYGGNEALAAAAYNAGPERVDEWLHTIGDPRTGQITNEQFASQIPIAETRAYTTGILTGQVPKGGGGGGDSLVAANQQNLPIRQAAAASVGGIGTQDHDKTIQQIMQDIVDRSKQGKSIYSSPWLPVIAAGLGMMASRSHFPGVAIGEGGLAGLNMLQQQAKTLPENELKETQAMAARLGLELMPQKMELAAQMASGAPTSATTQQPTGGPAVSPTGTATGNVAPTLIPSPTTGLPLPNTFGKNPPNSVEGVLDNQLSQVDQQIQNVRRAAILEPDKLAQHQETIARLMASRIGILDKYPGMAGARAKAVAEAEFPTKVKENLAYRAGMPVAVRPGEAVITGAQLMGGNAIGMPGLGGGNDQVLPQGTPAPQSMPTVAAPPVNAPFASPGNMPQDPTLNQPTVRLMPAPGGGMTAAPTLPGLSELQKKTGDLAAEAQKNIPVLAQAEAGLEAQHQEIISAAADKNFYTPGALSDVRKRVGTLINTVADLTGNPNWKIQEENLGEATAIDKAAFGLSTQAVHGISARPAQIEWQSARNSVPNNELPAFSAILLSNTLRFQNQYQKGQAEYELQQYKNGADPSAAAASWQAANGSRVAGAALAQTYIDMAKSRPNDPSSQWVTRLFSIPADRRADAIKQFDAGFTPLRGVNSAAFGVPSWGTLMLQLGNQ